METLTCLGFSHRHSNVHHVVQRKRRLVRGHSRNHRVELLVQSLNSHSAYDQNGVILGDGSRMIRIQHGEVLFQLFNLDVQSSEKPTSLAEKSEFIFLSDAPNPLEFRTVAKSGAFL